MAVHGKGTAVLIGAFDPSRYFTDITWGRTLDTHDSSGFQMDAKEYTPGMNDSTVSASGFFQGTLTAVEADFEAGMADTDTVDRFYLVLFGGWATGQRCKTGVVLRTAYEITSPVTDLVTTSMSMQGQPGSKDMRVVFHGEFTATGNGPTLDGSVAAPEGGTLQVHVTANDMDASTDLVVQHSTDGSVWVDLATVTVAAATTLADRVVVSEQINRYTRVIADASGTGTIVATVALARN